MDIAYVARRATIFTLSVMMVFAVFHGVSFIASAAGLT
jgi:hypothetical protein